MNRIPTWLFWVAGALGLSLTLAAIDSSSSALQGWLAYFLLCLVGSASIRLSWDRVRQHNPPKWLLGVALLALILRLAVGMGLSFALPAWGYETDHQQAGYLYPDAFNRDRDAWRLSQSDQPLWSAFVEHTRSDQYGGLVFLSSLTYRLLSPQVQRSTLMLVLSGLMGSLAVLFTWAFASQIYGSTAAAFAAWVMALYPEALLLGGALMREPYLQAGLAMALYGYARLRMGLVRVGLLAVLAGVCLTLIFSPPYGFLVLAIVGLAWIWEGKSDPKRTMWVLGVIGLLAVVAIGLTVRAWSLAAQGVGPGDSPGDLLQWWMTAGANFELYKLERSSGWVQKIFRMTPEWTHIPLATVNGLVQPFLPAAIMDHTGGLLARIIITWRACGWFFLLPALLYAPWAAIKKGPWRSLAVYFSLLVWATAILASYRLAGDQWDNPRSRVVFLTVQAVLAGWAWHHARETGSRWLRRMGVMVGLATLLFIQWYAGRYYHLPSLDLGPTLAVMIAGIVLIVLRGFALDRKPGPNQRLTEGSTEV